ncbi:MAG: GAF domain-containing protein [Spirochaetaceae bacterium]|nr:GAF domain-containing protein [Spirochaetaceae bacterium]
MIKVEARRWIEALAVGIAASVAGILSPGDPVFAAVGFYPQALAAVISASLLGAGPGFATIVASILATAALPSGLAALGLSSYRADLGSIVEAARFPLALALCGVLGAGTLRDASFRRESRLKERLRALLRKNVQLTRTGKALTGLNAELEARVSGQRESISSLYSLMRKMDSLDLDHLLSAFLEAVRLFSQADRAAIYEYDRTEGRLLLRSSVGEPPGASLPIEGSIEGWVFRNETPFTLSMLEGNLGLTQLDEKRNILAYPLKAGDLPWGVLNIQEMPFFRYNPATERNLEILVGLASSYLRKATDFRDRVLRRPRNEITGLPGYGELLRMLKEELARRAEGRFSLSVVIVEFLHFSDLVYSLSGVKALEIVTSFARLGTKDGRALAFHYREESQVAFVLPGVDHEGASLFCLGIMEEFNDRNWIPEELEIRLEPLYGLASVKAGLDAEALLAEAETVLGVSKNLFLGHAQRDGEGPRPAQPADGEVTPTGGSVRPGVERRSPPAETWDEDGAELEEL